jgi:hypothetical protein
MHLIVGRTGYSRVCVCVTAVVVMLHLGTSLCRPFYQASASLIALTFSTIVVKKSTFQRQKMVALYIHTMQNSCGLNRGAAMPSAYAPRK